jgi:hypothetical protein
MRIDRHLAASAPEGEQYHSPMLSFQASTGEFFCSLQAYSRNNLAMIRQCVTGTFTFRR